MLIPIKIHDTITPKYLQYIYTKHKFRIKDNLTSG